MSDIAVAKPAAAVPEPAVPADSEAQAKANATTAAKAKHSHSQSQSQPRKVRFNVGSNYKVLEIIGEGVSTQSVLFANAYFRPRGWVAHRRCSTPYLGVWRSRISSTSPDRAQSRHQEDRTFRSHNVRPQCYAAFPFLNA